jgi:Zn finger protein HypA/HybF involved in hydrogenase expression
MMASKLLTHIENLKTMQGVKSTLSEMQALAQKQGGRCLSSIYAGVHKKLSWRCARGHEWEARPSSIKSMGAWCPKCSGKKFRATIEEMQALAKKYNGRCLSSTYLGALTKLRWQCNKGHEWEATPASVKNAKHWCPVCRKNENLRKKGLKIS